MLATITIVVIVAKVAKSLVDSWLYYPHDNPRPDTNDAYTSKQMEQLCCHLADIILDLLTRGTY